MCCVHLCVLCGACPTDERWKCALCVVCVLVRGQRSGARKSPGLERTPHTMHANPLRRTLLGTRDTSVYIFAPTAARAVGGRDGIGAAARKASDGGFHLGFKSGVGGHTEAQWLISIYVCM